MQTLGCAWRQVTVSEVERRQRSVTVPELAALTLALGVTVAQLLDPRGPERIRGPKLMLVAGPGHIDTVAPGTLGPGSLNPGDTVTYGSLAAIHAADLGALVCQHEALIEVEWDAARQIMCRLRFVPADRGRS